MLYETHAKAESYMMERIEVEFNPGLLSLIFELCSNDKEKANGMIDGGLIVVAVGLGATREQMLAAGVGEQTVKKAFEGLN